MKETIKYKLKLYEAKARVFGWRFLLYSFLAFIFVLIIKGLGG